MGREEDLQGLGAGEDLFIYLFEQCWGKNPSKTLYVLDCAPSPCEKPVMAEVVGNSGTLPGDRGKP